MIINLSILLIFYYARFEEHYDGVVKLFKLARAFDEICQRHN